MEQINAILANTGSLFNHIVFVLFGLAGMLGMFIKMWSDNEHAEVALQSFLFGNLRNVIRAVIYFVTAWLTLAASGTIASQVDLSSVIILAVGAGAAVARDFNKTKEN
jgi:hypothetical protein